MKSMLKIVLTLAVAIALSVTGTTVASATLGLSTGAMSGDGLPAEEYSAKELFRGYVFLSGVVSEDMTELRKLKKNLGVPEVDAADVFAIQDEIMHRMEISQPGLLEDFAEEMRSGDPYLITSTLDAVRGKAVAEFEEFVESDDFIGIIGSETDQISPQICGIWVCGAAVLVGLTVALVTGVVVHLGVYFTVGVGSISDLGVVDKKVIAEAASQLQD